MVRFSVLGPVQVVAGQQAVPIERAQRRAVLAYLLLHAGHVVSVEQIVDALWGEMPPATARAQVFAAVSAVRRVLRSVEHDVISSVSGGYRIRVTDEDFDLKAFQACVQRVKGLLPGAAVAMLRSALAWWRGIPLAGITGAYLEPARAGLMEQKLAAQEQLYDLELALGHHRDIIAELRMLVEANPLRERLVGQMMLALYRCDRQADALAVFRALRRSLVEELGIDPSPELEALHRRILDNDGSLIATVAAGPTATAAPKRFLPRDIPDFTGRTAELTQLDAFAAGSADACGVLVISAIAGVAGVGKTALALRWAHREAWRFPDGQFYLDLRGYHNEYPMQSIEGVTALLRALGLPADRIPHECEDALALYRATLAARKVLILFDNARSVEQVRSLLPTGQGSLVLVTSRDSLAGLVARDGARRLILGTLPPADAVDLLQRILSPHRGAAEPAAVAALAEACGFLPLALRIAATNVELNPERKISEYLESLHRGGRIHALSVGDDTSSSLAAVFHHSYRALPAEGRRLFRLLGLIPGGDFTAEAVGALAQLAVGFAQRIMRYLSDAHLLSEDPSGRFSLHDLIREYAASLCDTEEDADARRDAFSRLLDWYVCATYAATTPIRRFPVEVSVPFGPPAAPVPLIGTKVEAFAWLDAECANLVATISQAGDRSWHRHTVQLAQLGQAYFSSRGLSREWTVSARAAVKAADRLNDPHTQVFALLDLGYALESVGETQQALAEYARALLYGRRIGHRRAEALTLNRLGGVCRRLGRHAEAAERYRAALHIFGELDDEVRQVSTQINLSVDLHLLGRDDEALDHAHAALALQQRLGGQGEAAVRTNLGRIYARLGRHTEAVTHNKAALELHRRYGSTNGEALALGNLCFSYARLGRHSEAIEHGKLARRITQRLSLPETEASTLNTLAEAYHLAGNDQAALQSHQAALAIATTIGDTDEQQRARNGLAHA